MQTIEIYMLITHIGGATHLSPTPLSGVWDPLKWIVCVEGKGYDCVKEVMFADVRNKRGNVKVKNVRCIFKEMLGIVRRQGVRGDILAVKVRKRGEGKNDDKR